MDTNSPRPTGVTIVPRLLDAVEALCAEMSPSDVTMRKIAAEAELSLGVAYRYFGSRDELLGAAMDRMGERIVAEAADDDSIPPVARLWKAIGENPAFPRLVTSLAMSGRYASDVMADDPFVDRVATASVADGMDDPMTVTGVTGVMVLAGPMFAPTLNRATGRDAHDPRVYEAMAEMLDSWLQAQKTKGPSDTATHGHPPERGGDRS